MRIIAPTLDIDDIATAKLISNTIKNLQGRENPYLILEANNLTYAQTVWLGSGWELEYQTGSIDQHFRSLSLLSTKEVTDALTAYLSLQENWNNGLEFEVKDIRGTSGKLGYKLGKLLGKLFRASET